MSNHSVIEHRANYHFIKVEEDYVHICSNSGQYPQCKAVILSILEHWINDKRSKGLDEYVYMTYPEWIDNMYGLFRRSTIIACLTDLEHEKLISRRPCKRHGKDTYEYTLNIQVVQEKLKQLPERNDKYCRPNLNASKFKRVQKQTGVNLDDDTDTNLDGSEHEDPSKNKRNIDTITYTPSNIDSDMSLSPESDAPAPIDFTEQKKKRDTDPRIPVVSSHSHEDIGNEETVKMPAVPKQTPAPGVPAIPPHGSDASAQAPIVSPSGDAAQRTVTGSGGAVQASDDRPPMALTAKQIEKQLERRQEEIFAIYEQKIGRKPSHSKANKDGAKLLAQDDVSDEDIKTTIDEILKDSFLAKNLNLTFVHSKLDALARKPTPMRQSETPRPTTKPAITGQMLREARQARGA